MIARLTFLLLVVILISACAGPQATAGTMEIHVVLDGESQQYDVPAGSTVRQSLENAGIELGPLDRTDPPGYTVLTAGSSVQVTRVVEEFEVEESVLPFERQTVRNEGLPEGETRLLQPGINGLQETTFRLVYEGDELISRTPVRQKVLQAPQPEIVMVGSQAAFTPVAIQGTLAYVSGGNAWLMEGSSANRQPVVVSGDLDGRILEISPDGDWLLFSRTSADEEQINSLWVIDLTDPDAEPLSVTAENVVHFAAWSPEQGRLDIAYSTVEPSPAAPGWQANNDLMLAILGQDGRVLDRRIILPANAGGQYGWWGTQFAWAPDGVHLAYARADSIGTVDIREPDFEELLEITPYQTLSDWAWIPGLTWGRDSRTLFFVNHGQPLGLEEAAASPVFNLAAVPPQGTGPLTLSDQTGMFAQPSSSPATVTEHGEVGYRLAYLQAANPLSSDDSTYRLYISDRDGSNPRRLFPSPDQPGLRGDDLQHPVEWSPDGDRIALRYRGDLWIVDVATGIVQQITGDGQTSAYDWKG